MWSIRTLLLFSESDSSFSAEFAQGYREILEFIQDLNHARGISSLSMYPTSKYFLISVNKGKQDLPPHPFSVVTGYPLEKHLPAIP